MTRIILFPVVAYPSVCDSQQPPSPPTVPVAEGDACRLEEQYVHQVYEEISSDFSSTRHSPWPHVRDFLLSLPPGSILADIGCGNGKYLGINPEVISVSNIPQQSLLEVRLTCSDMSRLLVTIMMISITLNLSLMENSDVTYCLSICRWAATAVLI